MKPKTIILMVLAVVCGLAASYMTSVALSKDKEMVTVVQAKKNITQWTIVKDPKELFEQKDIQKSKAHANFYPATDFDKLSGRRFKTALGQGEELTQEHLLDPGAQEMETRVKKGMRALALPISADKGVGFWVVPGNYVDLVHTVNGRSELLMENILVLAIDLNPNRTPEKPGMIGGTATLQLDPAQVLKVTGAKDRGTISLVMRSAGDDSEKPERAEEMAILAPPPPPPLPPEPKVEATPTETKTDVAKPQPKVQFMDIYQGSGFLRVEGTRNESGKMVYTYKTYEEAGRGKPDVAPAGGVPPLDKPVGPPS